MINRREWEEAVLETLRVFNEEDPPRRYSALFF